MLKKQKQKHNQIQTKTISSWISKIYFQGNIFMLLLCLKFIFFNTIIYI
jgi:hypothetical protein